MTDTYTPPKVWQHNPENGGKFASINSPTAGARFDKALPVGEHSFQLYSLATPNGVKVTVLFEELLEAGFSDAEYDAWIINIMEGEQFGSGFVGVNPNSKIPALVDNSGDQPINIFESGAMMLHLAEKFNAFIPTDANGRAQCLSWLMWQMGSAPMLGGGFGHFYAYAPEKFEYPIDRYTMEIKRQLDVLNNHLAHNQYMCGDQYTIADMAIWPWYGALVTNKVYEAATFISAHQYEHVLRWAAQVNDRPAVKRGVRVNKAWGEPESQVLNRHSADDFK